jgi:hypothetical protein
MGKLNERYLFVDMEKANGILDHIQFVPLWYDFRFKLSIILLHYTDMYLQELNLRFTNKSEDQK